MHKINRNQRVVATVKEITYNEFESEGIVQCDVVVNYRWLNNIFGVTRTTKIAINVDGIEKYDLGFGKELARAKAELQVYISLKKLAVDNMTSDVVDTDIVDSYTSTDLLRVWLNTIDFANKMIKHQKDFIHKLIRNKYPNE